MKLQSLGYRTDLFIHSFVGDIIDRGTYLCLRTPSNPFYHWGNFLLFPHPPTKSDFVHWRQLFAREFGPPERVGHELYGWDEPGSETGETDPFVRAGFRLERETVLSTERVEKPAHYFPNLIVRPLETESDWREALDIQVLSRDPEYDEEGYRRFKIKRMARDRQMVNAGKGHWFGAFLGEALVGTLGIFHDGQVGRFQSVGTHPDHRRRGVARTLVYESSRFAFHTYGVTTLVIVADQGSDAARMYQSVGYRPAEQQHALYWWSGMGPLQPDVGADDETGG